MKKQREYYRPQPESIFRDRGVLIGDGKPHGSAM
jgi:hypothetical protein